VKLTPSNGSTPPSSPLDQTEEHSQSIDASTTSNLNIEQLSIRPPSASSSRASSLSDQEMKLSGNVETTASSDRFKDFSDRPFPNISPRLSQSQDQSTFNTDHTLRTISTLISTGNIDDSASQILFNSLIQLGIKPEEMIDVGGGASDFSHWYGNTHQERATPSGVISVNPDQRANPTHLTTFAQFNTGGSGGFKVIAFTQIPNNIFGSEQDKNMNNLNKQLVEGGVAMLRLSQFKASPMFFYTNDDFEDYGFELITMQKNANKNDAGFELETYLIKKTEDL